MGPTLVGLYLLLTLANLLNRNGNILENQV